jgi:chromosome partitioning protein
MRTITVASAKGGAGKTTLTSALAVRASQDAATSIMDLNFDQGSLTQWWDTRRERSPNRHGPRLVSVEKIHRDVRKLATGGAYDWLFIDTPPLDMDVIEQAVAVADAVLIPVRPGLLDILAVQPVIEMCTERRKPFAFVLNAVDARIGFKTLTRQTAIALEVLGPTLKTPMSYRLQYISALLIGWTGPEIEKSLRQEIDALWDEVKLLAGAQ